MDYNKLENSERDENTRPPDLIWEICMHVKKQHLEPDMEQQTGSKYWDTICTGKVVRQGCIWSPFLVNFFAEYMMQNARLDEAPAGIKIAGRNINTDTQI